MNLAAIFILLGIPRAIQAQFELFNILPSHQKVLDDEEGLCPSGVHVLPGAIFEDELILNNSLNAQTFQFVSLNLQVFDKSEVYGILPLLYWRLTCRLYYQSISFYLIECWRTAGAYR